jgi:hypothetical protein
MDMGWHDAEIDQPKPNFFLASAKTILFYAKLSYD